MCVVFFNYAFVMNLLSLLNFLGKDYVIEALNFHLLKTEPLCNISQTFRCQPAALQKVCYCDKLCISTNILFY